MNPNHHSQPYYKLGLKLVGDKSVGKTSIFNRLSDSQAPKPWKPQSPALIGINTKTFETKHENKPVLVYLQDYNCIGESIDLFPPHYLKYSHGVMLIYDVTNRRSFIIVEKIYEKIFKSAPKEACVLLIGNKIDDEDERQVSYEEGRRLAEKLNVKFIEVSAKNRDGLDYAYKIMYKDMLNIAIVDAEKKQVQHESFDIVNICKNTKEINSCCLM